MSATTLAWLLSLAGAALFFSAGVLFQQLRSGARGRVSERGPRPAERGGPRATREPAPGHAAAFTAQAGTITAQAGAFRAHSDSFMPGSRADVFRAILDRETRGSDLTGAVIADELGLVVAATGDYGDALAAYGAFLAGVGTKTRDALPLHELRQVIVQDECNTTLTVRPLAAVDDNFALVTLAPGRQRENPSSRSFSER